MSYATHAPEPEAALEQTKYSLDGTIEAAFATVPRALVGPRALASVRGVARQIPASLTDWLYLETRLAAGESQVDLIVKVDEPGRAILAGENAALRLPAEMQRQPFWRRIINLCRAWGDPRSDVGRVIDHLWLEFDVDARVSAPTRAVPGVYVCFGEAPPPDFSRAGWCERAVAVLRHLLGRELTLDERRALSRCLMSLDDGAYAPYVGVMHGRPEPAVRVCITRLDPRAVPRYLRDVGWPGDAGALDGLLREPAGRRRGCATPDATMLHLDVSTSVAPAIGLEYTFERTPQLRGHLTEADFLDFLCGAGLCTREKAAALASWPGVARATLPHELWPSRLLRLVNHVKVVHRGDGSRFAKGYLCAWHAYLGERSRTADHWRMQ